MPNYDFSCEACGHEFQKLLPMGTKEAPCLLCSGTAQKQISAPHISFRGSGFYVNDSRDSSPKTTSPAPPPKKESKPEKKSS